MQAARGLHTCAGLLSVTTSQPLLFVPTHQVLCSQVARCAGSAQRDAAILPETGGVGPELLAVCPAGRLLHPTGTAPAPLCHEEESSSSSSCNTTSLRLKTKPARRARCAQGTPASPTSPWILCRGRQFQGTVKVSDFEQSPSFINSFLKFHS